MKAEAANSSLYPDRTVYTTHKSLEIAFFCSTPAAADSHPAAETKREGYVGEGEREEPNVLNGVVRDGSELLRSRSRCSSFECATSSSS